MMDRMAGNFELFIAHEIHTDRGSEPRVRAIRMCRRPDPSWRTVSCARMTAREGEIRLDATVPAAAPSGARS